MRKYVYEICTRIISFRKNEILNFPSRELNTWKFIMEIWI